MRTEKKARKLQPDTSAAVLESIGQALDRNINDDSEKISVELSGSKVILRGCVRSLAEKKTAEVAASSAPGVTGVQNKLLIEIPGYLF